LDDRSVPNPIEGIVKHLNILRRLAAFEPLMKSPEVQAAMMSLKPGTSSSDEVENEHPHAEQWLYVVSGSGLAKVGRRSMRIKEGDLLLIPKKVPHRISNTGRARLTTLNFYSPSAYTREGNVKSSVSDSN
jgi:mannose-6-phosphate isomerase-like protein (cupin superfamily)